MQLKTVAGSKASRNAQGPKSIVSPEIVTLSVFITPWTKPTSIHRATSEACAATTCSNSARAGRSASAAAGQWRATAWSASRRSRARSPVAPAYGERPDPQVAAGDPGEHRTGQVGLAADGATGRDHRQRAGGRDAERVHRGADDVLAQHRADGGQPVAAAGERRASRALEVQVAQRAVGGAQLAEQQRPAVAQPRGEAAELVARVGLRDRRGSLGDELADQQPQPLGAAQPAPGRGPGRQQAARRARAAAARAPAPPARAPPARAAHGRSGPRA